MKKVNIAFCTAMLFLIASCKKEYTTEKVETKTEIDPTKVYKTPSTPEEKLFVENLGKVTGIFKELYKDNSNLKLVNAAIFSKAYSDESVLLKDLIYPVDSWLSTVTKFKLYTNS